MQTLIGKHLPQSLINKLIFIEHLLCTRNHVIPSVTGADEVGMVLNHSEFILQREMHRSVTTVYRDTAVREKHNLSYYQKTKIESIDSGSTLPRGLQMKKKIAPKRIEKWI